MKIALFLLLVCLGNSTVASDSLPPTGQEMELWLTEDDHPMEALAEQSKQNFHKMIYSILTLTLIAFIVVWLLKKFLRRSCKGSTDGCFSLSVRERRALSPKTVLYVVEWMGQHFLLVESSLGVEKVAEHRTTLLESDAGEASLAPQ